MKMKTVKAIGAVVLLYAAPLVSDLHAGSPALSGTLDLPPARAIQLQWGRDPFVPLVRKVAAPDTVLKAIFYNAQRPSAIINGRIVYVGSEVEGQKIVDIGRTHVILQGVSGRVRLEIADVPEFREGVR